MKQVSLLLLLTFLCSCAGKEKFVYFQSSKPGFQNPKKIENQPDITILPDDVLAITINSVNAVAAAPYNLVRPDVNGNVTPIIDFQVDAQGAINYPGIGSINLLGLTISEAENRILQKVEPFLSDAVVNVRLTNFKVTVTGEVRRPDSYNVNRERITIVEAIGMAGDINDLGDRENLLLIRENQTERGIHHINMLSDSVFLSPYYYLRQNDIIYVPPTDGKAFTARSEPWSRVVLPVISVLASLASLIIIANR